MYAIDKSFLPNKRIRQGWTNMKEKFIYEYYWQFVERKIRN
jgi:hypothetical protein